MPDIQYLGHSCFRLRGRDGIVICDPFDRSVGLDLGRPTAHIVTVSQNHPAHNNTAAVKPVRDNVFIIDGPGEYEVRGVLITAVRSRPIVKKRSSQGDQDSQDSQSDQDSQSSQDSQTSPYGYNTIYVIHLDDVAFCHLGNLSSELSQQQLEELGNVDVLLVPVGGGETIGPAEAASVISQIEPRMAIPMRYATAQSSFEYTLAPLEKFTHEVGLKDIEPEEKLAVTSASLPPEGEQTRFAVMSSGSSQAG